MPKLLKIGIAGCGAIGSSLANTIARDFRGQACVTGLYDIKNIKSRRLAEVIFKKPQLATTTLRDLVDKSELVIEATSADSSWKIARYVLMKKRDIMIMSIGGVINRFKKLSRLAKRYNAKVYLPSGAISGIDSLKAARLGRVKRVILTTRKNPASFKGVDYIRRRRIDLDRIKRDTLLFSGDAAKAIRFFPQNINVAALLSIAGLGAASTSVRIIASPGLKRNIHEVKIESQAANILTRTENIQHPDNPKTSYLAALSAVATLRQILEPVKIGT